MKVKIPVSIAKIIGKVKYKMIDKAPEICFGTATAAGLGALILMYKESVAFQDILRDHNEKLEKLEKCPESYKQDLEERGLAFDEKNIKGLRRHVYLQTGVKTIRNFAPVVMLGTTAVILYAKGYGIVNGRYVSMAAAYAGLLKENISLKEEKYQKERRSDEDGCIVDENKGELIGTPVDRDNVTADEDARLWPYAKFFDESNENWEKNPEYNRTFLYGKQLYLDDKLNRDGYLFLNTVYDALGIPPTQAGQIMGWKKYKTDEEAAFHGAANHVSIGLFANTSGARDFMNGYENSILLRFNVDPEAIIGLVYPKE